MGYLDFKKSILAMFCSIDEKIAGESHFIDFQKRSSANWPLASHSSNATPPTLEFYRASTTQRPAS
jgi:hypothetical protein